MDTSLTLLLLFFQNQNGLCVVGLNDCLVRTVLVVAHGCRKSRVHRTRSFRRPEGGGTTGRAASAVPAQFLAIGGAFGHRWLLFFPLLKSRRTLYNVLIKQPLDLEALAK
jgi:hypothetical protein